MEEQDYKYVDLPIVEVQEEATQENKKSYSQDELDKILEEKKAEYEEKLKRKNLELQAKYLFKENKLDDAIIPYLKFTDEESLNAVFEIIKENYKDNKEVVLMNAHPFDIGCHIDHINGQPHFDDLAIRQSMGLI